MRRNTGLTVLLNLTLDELDQEIARCQMRRQTIAAASLRKKFDNRLRKLKSIRERKKDELKALDPKPHELVPDN